MSGFKHNNEANYIEIIQRLVKCIVVLLVIIVVLLIFLVRASSDKEEQNKAITETGTKQIAEKAMPSKPINSSDK